MVLDLPSSFLTDGEQIVSVIRGNDNRKRHSIVAKALQGGSYVTFQSGLANQTCLVLQRASTLRMTRNRSPFLTYLTTPNNRVDSFRELGMCGNPFSELIREMVRLFGCEVLLRTS